MIPIHSIVFLPFLHFAFCLPLYLPFWVSLYLFLVSPWACHLFSTFTYIVCKTSSIHLLSVAPTYLSWHHQCSMPSQYLGFHLCIYLCLAFRRITLLSDTLTPVINSGFLSSSVPTTPEKAGGGMKWRQFWLSQPDWQWARCLQAPRRRSLWSETSVSGTSSLIEQTLWVWLPITASPVTPCILLTSFSQAVRLARLRRNHRFPNCICACTERKLK